jgi:hypothetical protein
MMSATSDQDRQVTTPAIRRGTTRYLQRVGGERGQRVDLLGDAHGADLGRHRGADTAGHHQPGEDRPQLACHRQHDDGRDRAFGVEAAEPGIGLQRQHHAGEDRGQPTTGSDGLIADRLEASVICRTAIVDRHKIHGNAADHGHAMPGEMDVGAVDEDPEVAVGIAQRDRGHAGRPG